MIYNKAWCCILWIPIISLYITQLFLHCKTIDCSLIALHFTSRNSTIKLLTWLFLKINVSTEMLNRIRMQYVLIVVLHWLTTIQTLMEHNVSDVKIILMDRLALFVIKASVIQSTTPTPWDGFRFYHWEIILKKHPFWRVLTLLTDIYVFKSWTNLDDMPPHARKHHIMQ